VADGLVRNYSAGRFDVVEVGVGERFRRGAPLGALSASAVVDQVTDELGSAFPDLTEAEVRAVACAAAAELAGTYAPAALVVRVRMRARARLDAASGVTRVITPAPRAPLSHPPLPRPRED
jgi:hypothetical protein